MFRTTPVTAVVPVEVLDAARRRLGPGVTPSEAVRHALAQLAGVDPADYPVRPGRQPGPEAAKIARRAGRAAGRVHSARAAARRAGEDQVPA
jgi:hypothetical protein